MQSKIFFINSGYSQVKTYEELVSDIGNIKEIDKVIYTNDFYEIFLSIISSLLYELPIILLDYDMSGKEIKQLLKDIDPNQRYKIFSKKNFDEEIFQKIMNFSGSWEVTLFTSGTTGIPKKVNHTLGSLTRMVKISEEHKNDVWGFAYNPTHIAGLQVFFQALLNQNTIINLFGLRSEDICKLIREYKITNLSATPTFYRMLLPSTEKFESVKSLASGGEKFDAKLKDQLSILFPNGKIINIYASTEAGSLFASDSDIFEIKKELQGFIKIIENEICIHKSLVGKSEISFIEDEWYNTGDKVEIISENPMKFRIIGRKNEMINVGGYKVNPVEVEEAINSHPHVVVSKVYSKKNSVSGSILIADVQTTKDVEEKELRKFLSERLQNFKIPRIFNFNEEMTLTRTGKLKRR